MPVQDIWPKTAPDVTGDDQTSAEAALDALLIPFTYGEPELSIAVAVGSVSSQSPVGGSTMNLGDTMTLALSVGTLGGDGNYVPDCTGLNVSAAIQSIRDAGFYVTQLLYVDTNYNGTQVEPNLVYNQSPSGNSAALLNSAVSLVVATGAAFYGSPVGRYRFETITSL